MCTLRSDRKTALFAFLPLSKFNIMLWYKKIEYAVENLVNFGELVHGFLNVGCLIEKHFFLLLDFGWISLKLNIESSLHCLFSKTSSISKRCTK